MRSSTCARCWPSCATGQRACSSLLPPTHPRSVCRADDRSGVFMAEVESFTLDHTAVRAPYVRLIGVEHGPKGDAISNFDVRFVQPNEGEIPTAGLHTIEHL